MADEKDSHQGNPITECSVSTSSSCHAKGLFEASAKSCNEGAGKRDSSDGDSAEEEDQKGILKSAGVELNLEALSNSSDGVAPLALVAEFVSCCMREEYKAALILCNKILQFEPDNKTVLEFLPVIQERLKLDDELPTESSSESEEEDSNEESEGSEEEECTTDTTSSKDDSDDHLCVNGRDT